MHFVTRVSPHLPRTWVHRASLCRHHPLPPFSLLRPSVYAPPQAGQIFHLEKKNLVIFKASMFFFLNPPIGFARHWHNKTLKNSKLVFGKKQKQLCLNVLFFFTCFSSFNMGQHKWVWSIGDFNKTKGVYY